MYSRVYKGSGGLGCTVGLIRVHGLGVCRVVGRVCGGERISCSKDQGLEK